MHVQRTLQYIWPDVLRVLLQPMRQSSPGRSHIAAPVRSVASSCHAGVRRIGGRAPMQCRMVIATRSARVAVRVSYPPQRAWHFDILWENVQDSLARPLWAIWAAQVVKSQVMVMQGSKGGMAEDPGQTGQPISSQCPARRCEW